MCYLQFVNSLINRIVILFTFQMKFKLFFLIKSLRIADFRRDFFENWFIFNFFAIKFRMTKLIFRDDKNESCKYDFYFFSIAWSEIFDYSRRIKRDWRIVVVRKKIQNKQRFKRNLFRRFVFLLWVLVVCDEKLMWMFVDENDIVLRVLTDLIVFKNLRSFIFFFFRFFCYWYDFWNQFIKIFIDLNLRSVSRDDAKIVANFDRMNVFDYIRYNVVIKKKIIFVILNENAVFKFVKIFFLTLLLQNCLDSSMLMKKCFWKNFEKYSFTKIDFENEIFV